MSGSAAAAVSSPARTSPKDAIEQAELLQKAGQAEAAEALLSDCLEFNPSAHLARTVLARLLATQGRSGEAEQQFRAVLECDPFNIAALRFLLKTYPEDSPERLWLALRFARHADCPLYLLLEALQRLQKEGCWAEIVELTDSLVGEGMTAAICFARSTALIGLGEFTRAANCLKDLIVRFERPASEIVAQLVRNRSFRVAAYTIEQLCLDAASKFADLKQSVVDSCLRECEAAPLQTHPQRYSEAICALRILAPDRPEVLRGLQQIAPALSRRANFQKGQGDSSRAALLLRLTLEAAPSDSCKRVELAELLAATGEQRKAIVLLLSDVCAATVPPLLKLLQANRDWHELSQPLAEARELLGNIAGPAVLANLTDAMAEAVWRRLDQMSPRASLEHCAALVSLVMSPDRYQDLVAAIANRTRRAIRKATLFDRCELHRLCLLHLQLIPDDWEVVRKLARLKLRVRCFTEAKGLLESAIRCDPHNESDWRDLATCHARRGDAADSSRALLHSELLVRSEEFAEH